MAEEKYGVQPIRALLEVVVLFAAIFVILGGIGIVVFLSPWSRTILDRFLAYDIGFVIQLGAFINNSRSNSAAVSPYSLFQKYSP